MESNIDKTDRKILAILQENGRITNNALAGQIGLTTTPTLERVRRLQDSGIIKGYRAILDGKKIGKSMTVFAKVALKMHNREMVRSFCNSIQNLNQVMAAYHVAGDSDYLLKIMVKSTEEYEDFLLHHLTQLPGVEKIETMVVFSTKKEETKIPLEHLKQGDL